MNEDETPAATVQVVVRGYRPADGDAVLRLFGKGLLTGQVDPYESTEDIDDIEPAYLARPEDHFWVAEADGEVVGMIGVVGEEEHVARIRRLRVAPSWQDSMLACRLIEAAVGHCRRHGCLKLIVDTHVRPERAKMLMDNLGLQPTRRRDDGGRQTVEYYLNLYQQPDPIQGEPEVQSPESGGDTGS